MDNLPETATKSRFFSAHAPYRLLGIALIFLSMISTRMQHTGLEGEMLTPVALLVGAIFICTAGIIKAIGTSGKL